MPIYEYECEACGHRFEQIQKFSDPPIEICPKCGQPKVRKLLSSPAFQFKGSGWYITDYARKGGEGADSSKADAAGAKDDSKKSDKPPAAGSGTESSSSAASKEPAKTDKASPPASSTKTS